MHSKNPHRDQYPLLKLSQQYPPLRQYIIDKDATKQTIDFSNQQAVNALNTALMVVEHGIKDWSIPANNLCPGIPGRLDYLLHINDFLNTVTEQPGSQISILDIGTGAGAVYAMLAVKHLQWSAVASEIDAMSIAHSKQILRSNPGISKHLSLRLQPKPERVFSDVINERERFDVTVCNPPFYRSISEANTHNLNKQQGLKQAHGPRNFAGLDHELICAGGEVGFVGQMIKESHRYRHQVKWFTSLISQKTSVQPLKRRLAKEKLSACKWLSFQQGNKRVRIVAWSYSESS